MYYDHPFTYCLFLMAMCCNCLFADATPRSLGQTGSKELFLSS